MKESQDEVRRCPLTLLFQNPTSRNNPRLASPRSRTITRCLNASSHQIQSGSIKTRSNCCSKFQLCIVDCNWQIWKVVLLVLACDDTLSGLRNLWMELNSTKSYPPKWGYDRSRGQQTSGTVHDCSELFPKFCEVLKSLKSIRICSSV
jgi:hypothetical protein